MHAMNTMCDVLEVLAIARMDATDQLVDPSDSRVKKDDKDIKIFLEFFIT